MLIVTASACHSAGNAASGADDDIRDLARKTLSSGLTLRNEEVKGSGRSLIATVDYVSPQRMRRMKPAGDGYPEREDRIIGDQLFRSSLNEPSAFWVNSGADGSVPGEILILRYLANEGRARRTAQHLVARTPDFEANPAETVTVEVYESEGLISLMRLVAKDGTREYAIAPATPVINAPATLLGPQPASEFIQNPNGPDRSSPTITAPA